MSDLVTIQFETTGGKFLGVQETGLQAAVWRDCLLDHGSSRGRRSGHVRPSWMSPWGLAALQTFGAGKSSILPHLCSRELCMLGTQRTQSNLHRNYFRKISTTKFCVKWQTQREHCQVIVVHRVMSLRAASAEPTSSAAMPWCTEVWFFFFLRADYAAFTGI